MIKQPLIALQNTKKKKVKIEFLFEILSSLFLSMILSAKTAQLQVNMWGKV